MVQTFVQTILKTQSSYRQVIQKKMRENGLNFSFEMLFIIRCLEDSDVVNQQELANLVFKDKSSLSYLIKNMEKRGLVVRKEDERDKRNKLVKLTDKARQIDKQIKQIVEEVYTMIEQEINKEHIGLCIDYMEEFNLAIKDN